MKIKVEKKHIEQGVKGDCENCAIAKAIKAKLHHPVEVLQYHISVKKGGQEYCYNLPESATKFIRDFDAGRKVKPFTFETITYT